MSSQNYNRASERGLDQISKGGMKYQNSSKRNSGGEGDYDDEEFEEGNYSEEFDNSKEKKIENSQINKLDNIKRQNKKLIKYGKTETFREASKNNEDSRKNKLPSVYLYHKRKQTESSTNQKKGKYTQQIQERFERSKITYKTSLETINKLNTQMKQMIKQYNEDLKEMINKNLKHLLKKESKTLELMRSSGLHSIENEEILRNQIRNNQIVEENQSKQLIKLKKQVKNIEKLLSGHKQQDDLIDVSEKKQDEIVQTKILIKQTQKQLKMIKTAMQTSGKKLLPFETVIHPKNQNQMSEKFSFIKHKLHEEKVSKHKNSQNLEKLQNKIQELKSKLQSQEFQEKAGQASQVIENKKNQQMITKSLQERKKKLQLAKNHKEKTSSLYLNKANICIHDNLNLKQQISQLESLINQAELKNEQTNRNCQSLIKQLQINSHEDVQLMKKLMKLGYEDFRVKIRDDKNIEEVKQEEKENDRQEQKQYRVWDEKQKQSQQVKKVKIRKEDDNEKNKQNEGPYKIKVHHSKSFHTSELSSHDRKQMQDLPTLQRNSPDFQLKESINNGVNHHNI